MDVRDIMIEDFVEDPDYGVCKVVAINLSMGEYALSLEIVGDITEPFVCVDPKGVNPIPLTKKILKNNGFTTDPDGELSFCVCRDKTFAITMGGPGGYIDEIYPKYVHELQHLLRCCGIKKEVEL